MKTIILSLTALVMTTALFAQKKSDDVAKFTSEIYDYGKIKQGVPAVATFTVTNISKEPLIIELASPTCGCTISDYTKEPIAPGKTGIITATFNAASPSHIDKHLTVKFAGVDDIKSITLTGDVLAVEDYDKWKAESGAPAIVKTQQAVPAVKAVTVTKAKPSKVVPVAKAKSTAPVKAKKPVPSVTKN